MTDIVERLRSRRSNNIMAECREAAAEILALRARLAEAEALLRTARGLIDDAYDEGYWGAAEDMFIAIDDFLERK